MNDLITWNPQDKESNAILINNNLTVDCSNVKYPAVRATKSVTKGKWYWEITLDEVYNHGIGICTKDFKFDSWLGCGNSERVYLGHRGEWYWGGSNKIKNGTILKKSDIVGVCLDMDDKKIQIIINGQLQNEVVTFDFNEVYPTFGKVAESTNGSVKSTVNFGSSLFNIKKVNRKLYIDLVKKGYKPYDYINFNWELFKYLILKNNQYYTMRDNQLALLENQIIDDENFNLNGFVNLNVLNEIDKTDMELIVSNKFNFDEANLNCRLKSSFKIIDKYSNLKLLVYDESNPDKLKLKYTLKEQFRPIDKFEGKIKILKQEIK